MLAAATLTSRGRMPLLLRRSRIGTPRPRSEMRFFGASKQGGSPVWRSPKGLVNACDQAVIRFAAAAQLEYARRQAAVPPGG